MELNQLYLDKLVSLVKRGVITKESIKDEEYRNVVESILTT